MHEGNIVYHGPRDDLKDGVLVGGPVAHFESLGYRKPANIDIADFLQVPEPSR